MKRTLKTLERMRDILNTNPVIQAHMEALTQKAIDNGVTVEQWEALKVKIMTALFFQMCEIMPEIKNDLAADIYEEIRKGT